MERPCRGPGPQAWWLPWWRRRTSLRDWEPIKFLVNLTKPARLSLALYTLAREKAYIAEMQGAAGLNTLIWELQNYASQPAAGVLYIYVLQTDSGNQTEKGIGKVVVIR